MRVLISLSIRQNLVDDLVDDFLSDSPTTAKIRYHFVDDFRTIKAEKRRKYRALRDFAHIVQVSLSLF